MGPPSGPGKQGIAAGLLARRLGERGGVRRAAGGGAPRRGVSPPVTSNNPLT
jgi:hypothetical protein